LTRGPIVPAGAKPSNPTPRGGWFRVAHGTRPFHPSSASRRMGRFVTSRLVVIARARSSLRDKEGGAKPPEPVANCPVGRKETPRSARGLFHSHQVPFAQGPRTPRPRCPLSGGGEFGRPHNPPFGGEHFQPSHLADPRAPLGLRSGPSMGWVRGRRQPSPHRLVEQGATACRAYARVQAPF